MTDFLGALCDMRSGKVIANINDKFNELVDAVLNTGLKGKLTLDVFVEPSKFGMGGIVIEVTAEHDCKIKKPELAVGDARFFVTRDRRLTRTDPDQAELELPEGSEAQHGRQ